MKVLLMSDDPGLMTGMGRVHREIGRGLKRKGFEVVSIGWFSAYWLTPWSEWKVYKTNNNYYASDIFDQVICQENPDVVLTIGDSWMVSFISDPLKCKARFLFQWVAYVPVDGEAYGGGLPPSWISMLRDIDVIVAYTEYGKRAISKSVPDIAWRVEMIPHGVDMNVYKMFRKDDVLKARRRLGIPDDFIVFLMVCRNQFRKNIPEFCKGWKLFKKDGKAEKALFWPHMVFRDPMGWDLWDIFNKYDMKKDLVYLKEMAESNSNLDLIEESQLSVVYNMADVVVMMAGEGFGLPTLEAMASGKPILALKHSANIELVEGRGELVEVQNYVTGGHSTERPIPSLEDLSNKLLRLYNNPKLREEYGMKSLEFARTLTWDVAIEKWYALLNRVNNPFVEGEMIVERIC
jgi:glycosyltransferase involved in cell wall biosynthesis